MWQLHAECAKPRARMFLDNICILLTCILMWHAGNEPVPAPAQAATTSFVQAVAPSLNDLTDSLIQLIPSPPPPPPPPTVIQALAPLEEVRG